METSVDTYILYDQCELYISMHARYTEFIHCMQSRRDGIIITTSPAAGVLSSDCLRYGVLVQEELCTQRPCCQEHTGGKWEDMQGCNIKDSITQKLNTFFCYRLQILGCPGTCLTVTIMSLKEEGFLLSGQLQRYTSVQIMHNNFVVLVHTRIAQLHNHIIL